MDISQLAAVWKESFLRISRTMTGPVTPLQRGENVRPFFIVGSGRSGTTLMRRILTASGHVHVPPETYVLGGAIDAVFPQARYVHLLRDGVDVVASYLEARNTSDLAAAAERWRTAIRRATAFSSRNPERCMLVRYEDLATDPGDVSRRVYDFLDIPYEVGVEQRLDHVPQLADIGMYPHLGKVADPVSAGSVGRGRRAFTLDQLRFLDGLIGKDLKEMGYEPALAKDRPPVRKGTGTC